MHLTAFVNHKEKSMTLHGSLRCGAMVLLIALLAMVGSPVYAAEHNVSPGIQLSKDLGRPDPSTEINVTVHLKRNDEAEFQKALTALYDPASPTFHKWMTNADLVKYAPSEAQRETVRQELERNGLTILETDQIGFTIRAHGTIASVESAFNTEIHQFEYQGKNYQANVTDAHLNGEAGDYVLTVGGLERHQARPHFVRAKDLVTQKSHPAIPLTKLTTGGFPAGSTADCLSAAKTEHVGTAPTTASFTGTVYMADSTLLCDYLPNQLWTLMGLDDVYANGYNGKGQTIALVEAYGYPTLLEDANAFSAIAGLPPLNSSNLSFVYPEGKTNPEVGVLSGWDGEIALDIDWAHVVAPGAKIVEVITSGQDNEDFQASILYLAENSLATSVSNSYGEDVDLLAGPLEQTSWDNVLAIATAKGIAVNFSTGDSGDNGLGTPVGAPGVPASSPHATAVGGVSILNDPLHPDSTITTSWGNTMMILAVENLVEDPPLAYPFTGGGSGGESVYWPKPDWQSALPGTGRQTPDISALADPFTGVPIVITVKGVPSVEYGVGGTSLASPIFSAIWALANQRAGASLGQAAPLIASLPYGSVQDVLPTSDESGNNVTGTIKDSNGTTNYSASNLFGTSLDGNKGFTSTLSENGGFLLDLGFGLDSSLTVGKGWDNATGFGTPYGMTFINAVVEAAAKK
jgi:subtilase family serine protease